MPLPQGAFLGIPSVAAWASSSWPAGTTCTSLLPLEVSAQAGPRPPLLIFRGRRFLDQFFGFHPWGWSVIRRRPGRP